MVKENIYTEEDIREILDTIKDPEIPVVSIEEMGIIRSIHMQGDACEVIITPTYTACPAMHQIAQDIRFKLQEAGFNQVKVTTTYFPAWSTDLMRDEVKNKLRTYGIAPPVHSSCMNWMQPTQVAVHCPRCGSAHTQLISQFGSTPCKSQYACKSCDEPFDYFKCH